MIEQGLTALVTADPGVSALIGTCFYPVILPETPTYPCMSYQVVSASSEYNLGATAERWKRIQFDAYGQAYSDCKAIVAALDTVLDGYTGTLPDGTQILGSFRVVELDLMLQYSRVFRTMVEYTFHFRPA